MTGTRGSNSGREERAASPLAAQRFARRRVVDAWSSTTRRNTRAVRFARRAPDRRTRDRPARIVPPGRSYQRRGPCPALDMLPSASRVALFEVRPGDVVGGRYEYVATLETVVLGRTCMAISAARAHSV